MKKNFFIVIAILIVIAIVYVLCSFNTSKTELKSIKNMEELNRFYKGEYSRSNDEDIAKKLVTLPFSAMNRINRPIYYEAAGSVLDYSSSVKNSLDSLEITPTATETTTTGSSDSSSRDYSKTNIQVENVDEADITKTDGNYIYSISEDNVIITDVKNPEEIKIAAKITISDGSIPEDLIIYKDKIVVVCSSSNNSVSYYKYNTNTVVKIYNIQNREDPKLEKSYTLYEPYYTSRCIEGRLYVISSGTLRKEKNDVITYYTEDNEQKDIGLDNIKYFDEVKTNKQTLISFLNLNDIDKDVKVSSYLIDTSNAYVSEGSIYILNQKYNARNNNYFGARLKKLFGPLGVIGLFKAEIDYDYDYEYDYDYGTYTHIYKFSILEDGQIKYANKNSVKGTTINQYSIDEYNNKLRLALYTTDGSRIVVFDDKLEKLGETSYLAKGEKMYSSRFMGNKAYMVTYRTVDPLYVIDLTDSYKPKVLGELKIPGYSTYLHPYDENHLIGIGMETKETVNRNAQGKVTSTTARIIGMKMALFDVTDLKNPKQISSTVIGDSRTTSAILTNPKALLFSKEKELIAIPVNNFAEDFSVNNGTDVASVISNYTSYNKKYISEGYLVYKINIKDGIKLNGVITHDKESTKYYYNTSRLLRGLYIDDNLYTVSEDYVKVNKLDDLEEVGKIGITKKAIQKIEQELIGVEEAEKKEDLIEVKNINDKVNR